MQLYEIFYISIYCRTVVHKLLESSYPSRTRYLLDIYKRKSYLPETYLIDNYLVT